MQYKTLMKKCRTKEEARQFAIEWGNHQCKKPMSFYEVAEWQRFFETLANKFHLKREFKENGLI